MELVEALQAVLQIYADGGDVQTAQDDTESDAEQGGDQESTDLADENARLRAIVAAHTQDVDAELDAVLTNRKGEFVYHKQEAQDDAQDSDPIQQLISQLQHGQQGTNQQDATDTNKQNVSTQGRRNTARTAANGKTDLSAMSLEEKAKFYQEVVAPADAAGRSVI